MDRRYISQLQQFCKEINEQEVALLNVQEQFLRPPTLPLYRLNPTIQLLQRIRNWMNLLIHIHERDAHRELRAYYLDRVPTLDVNWCCRCRATPCLYD